MDKGATQTLVGLIKKGDTVILASGCEVEVLLPPWESRIAASPNPEYVEWNFRGKLTYNPPTPEGLEQLEMPFQVIAVEEVWREIEGGWLKVWPQLL